MSIARIVDGARGARNSAEGHERGRGTQRVLAICMHDIDAIEAINVEQLATVTDRLLLRGRITRRRLSTSKILVRPDRLACGTGTYPVVAVPPTSKKKKFPTSAAVITALASIAASLATML